MAESTNPEPPPDWMLPSFNPNNAKVSELRSILLENNIPHSYTKKSHLVELFERQVRPLAPKLLKAHLSVKPSAVGIFDMRTGQYITEPSTTPLPAVRSPRKHTSSIQSTDRESPRSTTSTRRTKRSSSRNLQERELSAAEADDQSTPQAKSRRDQAVSQKSQRRSTLIDPPSEAPPKQLGKRKASEQTLHAEIDELESEQDQSARSSQQLETSNSNSSSSLVSSSIKSSASPAPVKKRRSELPTQSSASNTNADGNHPTISNKKNFKPKNRRTTLHEAIESGEGKFSDFNPFQSGSEDNVGGSSPRKPRSSKRQSSVHRPSMTPARLPKSITTPNVFLASNPLSKPNPASSQVPVSSPIYQTKTAPSILPKSITTSNVHSLQTPVRDSTRRSGPPPSLPSHRRLTQPHLQDDHSFEFGTPEQIQELLVPGEDRVAQNQPKDRISNSSPQYGNSREQDSEINTIIPISAQSRRQSQLPPRTPHAQPPVRSSSNLQFQTPLSRQPIQRIKLDEFVHTPAEKRLKINRNLKASSQQKHTGLLFNPSQGISFLLRLVCLSFMVGLINWYLRQAESLGYCDTGMTSNAMTRDQRIDQFLALDEPISNPTYPKTFRTKMIQVLEAASMIGLLPDCQPCPPHAVCERGKIVKCDLDFVQTHSDWEKFIHRWIPMIMGPKCAPDTAKLIKIVQVGNEINHLLRKQRGKVLCGMGLRASDEETEKTIKVEVYGLKEEEIKELIRSTEDSETSSSLSPNSITSSTAEDDIIELAIQDLEQSGEIVRSKSGWLATSNFKLMEMGLNCRLKLGFFKLIKKFKLVLITIALLIVAWMYLKIAISKNNEEKQQVRELVELALNKLRDESWIHHTNPALSPNPPTLASAQLRDLILSYEHSPLNRQKIWKKVEKIVEGNSNVRTKVSELRGESIKVWEWIGSYKGHFNVNQSAAAPHGSTTSSRISHQFSPSPDTNL